MGNVTKTITETVGQIQQTTTYHFTSFEDFMEYERDVNKLSEGDGVNCSFTTTKAPLVVGKKYRVIKDFSEHGQDIGSIVTVIKYDDWDEHLPYQVEDDFGNCSWLTAEEVEEK